jgi:hypothetical protein
MKTINIYNLDQIVKIQIKDKEICPYVNYQNEQRNMFGKVTSIAGFYPIDAHFTTTEIYTAEQLECGDYNDIELIVENNIVYYLPFVKIYFTSGNSEIKEFRKFDDAKSWAEEISEKSIKNKLID